MINDSANDQSRRTCVYFSYGGGVAVWFQLFWASIRWFAVCVCVCRYVFCPLDNILN